LIDYREEKVRPIINKLKERISFEGLF